MVSGLSLADGHAPYVVAVKSSHAGACCPVKTAPSSWRVLDSPVKLSVAVSLPNAALMAPGYVLLDDQQVAALRQTYCRLYRQQSPTAQRAKPEAPPQRLGPHITFGVPSSWGASSSFVPPMSCGPALAAPPQSTATMEQSHVPALLAMARQMASRLPAAAGAGQAAAFCGTPPSDPCPECEWETGLVLLAEALSMHCHTRSADDIIGFLRDSSTSAVAMRPMAAHDLARAAQAASAASAAETTTLTPFPARDPQ